MMSPGVTAVVIDVHMAGRAGEEETPPAAGSLSRTEPRSKAWLQ